MPIPGDLLPHLSDPSFWARFFFEEEGDDDEDLPEELEECSVPLMLDERHGLVLDLDLSVDYHSLSVVAPGLDEPVEVGWDDQAHFHPHVFRWDELDLLCRALAVADPSLAHPGTPLALLCRFAFLSGGEDLDAITPLLTAAFHRLRPDRIDGYWPTARDWLDWRDLRDTGVTWHRDENGNWTVDQQSEHSRDLYSMRIMPEDGAQDGEYFPFAAWTALFDQARRTLAHALDHPWRTTPEVQRVLRQITDDADLSHAPRLGRALRNAGCDHPALLTPLTTESADPAELCWIIEELAGLDRGDLVRRHFGTSPLASARTFELSLHLDVLGRPDRYARDVAADIDLALRDGELGRAELDGSTMRADDHVTIGAHLTIWVRDDLDRAVAAIAGVLREHTAPAGTRLTQVHPLHTELPWPTA